MSQLDHIANRIAWRARKNAVWTRNTRLWKFAEDSLKERVGAELEQPVFFSVANQDEGVVFGAEALLVLGTGKSQAVPYRDLLGARCPEVGIAAPSEKEFPLNLNVRSRGSVHAKVEGGAAGYGVWRVLQMILKMGEGWFAPEPEPEPETEPEAASGTTEEAPEAEAGETARVPESDAAETEAPSPEDTEAVVVDTPVEEGDVSTEAVVEAEVGGGDEPQAEDPSDEGGATSGRGV